MPRAACKPHPTQPQHCPPRPPPQVPVSACPSVSKGFCQNRGDKTQKVQKMSSMDCQPGVKDRHGVPWGKGDGPRGGKIQGPWGGNAPGCPREIQGPRKGQLWGPRGDRQHAWGDRQRSPGDIGSRGGTATGPQGDRQHAQGDSGGPLEIWGPQGACSTRRGMAAVPKGVPREGRQWDSQGTGSISGGDPPQ